MCETGSGVQFLRRVVRAVEETERTTLRRQPLYICGNWDVLRVPLSNQPTVQADGVQTTSSQSKTQAHAID